MLNEKNFKSSDKMTDIYYVEHLPETKPKACIIIAHGIGEHTGRYNDFANFLTEKNIAVFAYDCIGHGKSVSSKKAPMYFGENGWDFLVKDLISLNKIVKNQYPETPCFILGFSMGSFVLRTALAENAKELQLDGAILAGTGSIAAPVAAFVRMMVSSEAKKIGGADKVSEKVNKLAFGNYNKHFQPTKTSFDWLCKNEVLLQEYIDDSKSSKVITPGMFGDLLDGMARVSKKSAIKKTKKVPILFLFGEEDPVGNFGKAVHKLANEFRMNNFKVVCKSYSESRHDIFHDNDQEKVYMDTYEWMMKVLSKKAR